MPWTAWLEMVTRDVVQQLAARSRTRSFAAQPRPGATAPGKYPCEIENLEPRQLLSTSTAAFLPDQTYTAGIRPMAIAVANLNADSQPDIVFTNSGDNNIGVLLNAGNNTFTGPVTYAVGNRPNSIAVADVNNDGKADIVVTDSTSNTLSLLLGNGDGTFAAQTTIAAGTLPSSVVIIDVNGDNKPDIVVANSHDNNVGVLLGNNNGTFSAEQTFATGNIPSSVAVMDINGDHIPDLVTANSGAGTDTVSVLLGNGNGTFQPQLTFAAGPRPASVALADLNNDGKIDIVTGNNAPGGPNSVGVLLGNGDGSFQAQVTYAGGLQPNGVTVADINGDGAPDVIVADRSSPGQALVLLGNGDGTLGAPGTFATGGGLYSIVVADVNGDGTPDLVAADYGVDVVDVLLGAAAPIVLSVDRANGAAQTTNAATASFTVTFSESVSTPTSADFKAVGTGTLSVGAPVIVTPVNGSVYTVTVSDISGIGDLGLNVVNNGTITDSSGVPLRGVFTGAVYTFVQRDATLTASNVVLSFDENPHAGSVTATGVNGEDLSSLLQLSYQNQADNSMSATPPTQIGTYEVFASFPGNADYNAVPTFDTGTTVKINVPSPVHALLSGKLPTFSLVAGQKIKPIHQSIKLANTSATAFTGVVTVNVTLSTTTHGSPSDPVVGTVTKTVKLKGSKNAGFGAVTIKSLPAGLSGMYYLVAKLTDPTNATSETPAATTLNIAPPFLDLGLVSLKAPAKGRRGTTLHLTLAVADGGNIPFINSVPLELFLSTGMTVDSSSIDLGIFGSHASIQPGKKANLRLIATIPSTATPGFYFVIANLDPNGTLGDTNAANNSVVSATMVSISDVNTYHQDMEARRLTFPRSHRLSSPPRFAAVYDARVRETRGPLVIYALPNSLTHYRMGLSVSRRVGTAPRRNRIKRLLREAYRALRHDFPAAYDLVIVVRPHEPLPLDEYAKILGAAISKLHSAWLRRTDKKSVAPDPRAE